MTRAVCILRGWSITCLPHMQPRTEPAFCPLPKIPRKVLAGQAGPCRAPSLARLALLSLPPVHAATQADGLTTSSQSHYAPWGIWAEPCRHGCSVVRALQRAGALEPVLQAGQSHGWRDGLLGVRAAQKQGLTSLSLTLKLRFPSARLGVEPCGNSLMDKGKRSPRTW